MHNNAVLMSRFNLYTHRTFYSLGIPIINKMVFTIFVFSIFERTAIPGRNLESDISDNRFTV